MQQTQQYLPIREGNDQGTEVEKIHHVPRPVCSAVPVPVPAPFKGGNGNGNRHTPGAPGAARGVVKCRSSHEKK
jgi:hypothetical protein